MLPPGRAADVPANASASSNNTTTATSVVAMALQVAEIGEDHERHRRKAGSAGSAAGTYRSQLAKRIERAHSASSGTCARRAWRAAGTSSMQNTTPERCRPTAPPERSERSRSSGGSRRAAPWRNNEQGPACRPPTSSTTNSPTGTTTRSPSIPQEPADLPQDRRRQGRCMRPAHRR